ncbi:hypothetical protein SAMN02982917_4108 [Azospirillum oryzae]|uniref:Uncharacterized protein n=1 Tax=Azospirillum oryzae TaxID=286727 RepID=A0A1X7GPB5_9PROT|nr:hypothetical protein [Azospirillum oryzae]SMF72217.1 hypothetical protein SAMN02982917_4108 [Azospirillum oryzae]
MTEKKQPIARCLTCGTPYYSLAPVIDGCVTQTVSGRCDGEVVIRWNNDDWIICPHCDGSGCPHCDDIGWLPARP